MRYIKQYRVVRPVPMPGLYMIDDLADRAIMSTQHPVLQKGERIWGRVDDRAPDEYVVETSRGCYKLTKEEWTKFRPHLASTNKEEEL